MHLCSNHCKFLMWVNASNAKGRKKTKHQQINIILTRILIFGFVRCLIYGQGHVQTAVLFLINCHQECEKDSGSFCLGGGREYIFPILKHPCLKNYKYWWSTNVPFPFELHGLKHLCFNALAHLTQKWAVRGNLRLALSILSLWKQAWRPRGRWTSEVVPLFLNPFVCFSLFWFLYFLMYLLTVLSSVLHCPESLVCVMGRDHGRLYKLVS